MKRKFHFVLQAKGGVGKSLYTYLKALSQAENNTLFVDVDSSTQTSSRQLLFLGNQRLERVSLIDKREVLVRDIFVGYMESLVDCPFEQIYMDFGAPESEQFPALISRDLDFKAWCDELGYDVTFHIVMAAGGAYLACGEYLSKIYDAIQGQFRIIACENIHTFKQYPKLSQELKDHCTEMGIEYGSFGDFDSNSLLGTQILDGIRNGYSLDQYRPGARIRLSKELREYFDYE